MSKPYTPPFSITTSMLNQVSLISEKVGVLSIQQDWQSPQLRKTNQIKTITGTLQIEGNTLNEAQVSAILEGKRVLGSPRELAEVQGAIKAYEQLAQLDPYTTDDLCTAHQWLMGDILKQAGQFRIKAVGILPLESIIREHQQAYYQALAQADREASANAFIHFMLEAILQTVNKNAAVNASVNAPVNLAGLKTAEAIRALLAQNPAMTHKEMAAKIGKDLRTIGRAIKQLQDKQQLRRIGSDKTGYWELL